MNKYLSITVILAVFLIAYFAGHFLSSSQKIKSQEIDLGMQPCSPVTSICHVLLDRGELTLQFLQQPAALTPFDVEVTTRGFLPEKINITFVMKDMDMGFNSFYLEKLSEHKWQVKAILPVCSLGRNDWIAEIRVKQGDKITRTDFSFE